MQDLPSETQYDIMRDDQDVMNMKAELFLLKGSNARLELRLKQNRRELLRDIKQTEQLEEDLELLAKEKHTWQLVSATNMKDSQLVEYISELEQDAIKTRRKMGVLELEMHDVKEQLADFKSANSKLDHIKESLEILSNLQGSPKKRRGHA